MPNVAGRNVSESYRSISRSSSKAQIRVILTSTTTVVNNERVTNYVYGDREINIGQTAKTRRMVQKVNPDAFYEFTFPPTQIAYEGFGTEITEIPRPLQKPLLDVRAARNYKAVFEFLVAEQFDGLTKSVEAQLETLEWMANTSEPVYFENFDTFLTKGFWYIGEFSIKTSRVNADGKIVAAQCSMGLIEYQETEQKFSKFPKINYAKKTTRKKGGSSTSGGDQNPISGQLKGGAATVPGGNTSGTTGSEGKQQTVVYRWSRTKAPASFDLKKAAWQKVGNRWYLYSTDSRFPYSNIDTLDFERQSGEKVVLENQIQTQKAAYNASVAALKKAGVKLDPAKTVTVD